MISNYVLRHKIDSLKSKKDSLGQKKKELQVLLSDCGLSHNQRHKLNKTGRSMADEATLVNRGRLLAELNEVEQKIITLNIELRKCYAEDTSERNMALLQVFKEVFSQEQIVEIKIEAQRRMAGEPPMKVSFSVKDAIEAKEQRDRYRQLAKEQLEKMVEFRIILTGLIERGCDKFGDAEFLKFISPLNRLIIPLSDLESIIRKNNL